MFFLLDNKNINLERILTQKSNFIDIFVYIKKEIEC